MHYEDFLGHVQHEAKLASQQQAVAITRATLETLAERLLPGQVESIAAQLPQEIGRFMREHEMVTERFDAADFVERVGERAHVDKADATFQVRAVFKVVTEATSPGTTAKLADALPPDLVRLVQAGTAGKL